MLRIEESDRDLLPFDDSEMTIKKFVEEIFSNPPLNHLLKKYVPFETLIKSDIRVTNGYGTIFSVKNGMIFIHAKDVESFVTMYGKEILFHGKDGFIKCCASYSRYCTACYYGGYSIKPAHVPVPSDKFLRAFE